MKVHILYPFKEGAWGGGNQFLKALKVFFQKVDVYSESLIESDVVIFNANPSALIEYHDLIYTIKKNKPDISVVVRIDGPVFLIRNDDLEIDRAFYMLCSDIADGVIYQSLWSKNNNSMLGMNKNNNETVIINAPDKNIFNIRADVGVIKGKPRIVATSWSSNIRKGFDIYKWMDENLDFDKYDMVFIGNSPYAYKNIQIIQPISSDELGIELKNSHIFITASENDPCSNSLIEAMHCGLPALVLNDGGHPEIVGKSGRVFNYADEIPNLIEDIVKNYKEYASSIRLPEIDEVGFEYKSFLEDIHQDKNRDSSKKYSFYKLSKIKLYLYWWVFSKKIKIKIIKKLTNKFNSRS